MSPSSTWKIVPLAEMSKPSFALRCFLLSLRDFAKDLMRFALPRLKFFLACFACFLASFFSAAVFLRTLPVSRSIVTALPAAFNFFNLICALLSLIFLPPFTLYWDASSTSSSSTSETSPSKNSNKSSLDTTTSSSRNSPSAS